MDIVDSAPPMLTVAVYDKTFCGAIELALNIRRGNKIAIDRGSISGIFVCTLMFY